MTHSESIKNIMVAVQNVQQNVGVIKRNETADLEKYKYKYAGFPSIWAAIKSLLKANNLTIIQSPTISEHTAQLFQTTIYDTAHDEWISETMMLGTTNTSPQAIGSAISYYRRYMIVSMLGLITDDDTDASEHRLANAEQKARIIGALKLSFPEVDKMHMIETLMNIVGKHPSDIREDEVENVIGLIKAFVDKK